MIPYAAEPALRLGRVTIPAFGALMVAGILMGRAIMLRRGKRLGIAREEIVPFYLCMLVAGLAGAFLAEPLLNRAHAGLLAPGLSSIGGFIAGYGAGIGWCLLRRYSLARMLVMFDLTAFAAPFAACVARMGCALAHDHRGLPSHAWFAVQFPEGGRYDLGLMECAFLAVLSGVFLILDRKPRQAGFYIALAGVLYGGFRMWLETLRIQPHAMEWAVVCAGAIIAGVLAEAGPTVIARVMHVKAAELPK